MKTFFKKMIGVAENVLGTLTVICPELIIRKGFDVKVDTSNKLMRVSAKHFYNYLGHWLVPDKGLKEGNFKDPYQVERVEESGKDTEQQLKTLTGRGLGKGPFSYNSETNTYNDLTKALDKKVYSLPSQINRNEIIEEPHKIDENGKPVPITLTVWDPALYHTDEYHSETASNENTSNHYAKSEGASYSYKWDGLWGEPGSRYETEVTFALYVTIRNDRVTGSISGDFYPTGAQVLVWCGDGNDYNTDSPAPAGSYYETPSSWNVKTENGGPNFSRKLKKFYNPFFSTGRLLENNGGIQNYYKQITIKRPPFSEEIIFHSAAYTRGGHRYINIVPDPPGAVAALDGIGIGPYSLKIGSKVWAVVVAPFILWNAVLNQLLGSGEKYNGRADIRLDLINQKFATINEVDAQAYPLYMNFGNMSPVAYLYNQFEYQAFDRNAFFPFGDVMFMKKPFLLNKVTKNRYSSYSYSQNKSSRKYKYFIPNLFRLTFETNIGVYLEQLAKQHTTNVLPHNFLTKTSNHTSFEEPANKRDVSEMDEHLDQLLFPTNSDKWNTYIENGWGYNKASDLAFLTNFISSATKQASIIPETMPSEYTSIFTKYPVLENAKSITAIDTIIGTHTDLKQKLEADDGQDLNTWAERCNTAASPSYSGLTSSNPRNLSYKLIEYMLWYLDDEGKAFEIRNAVSNLISYEEYLDELLPKLKGSSGSDLSDYHVIGTELYDRKCKE
jgi:hypothetical protein